MTKVELEIVHDPSAFVWAGSAQLHLRSYAERAGLEIHRCHLVLPHLFAPVVNEKTMNVTKSDADYVNDDLHYDRGDLSVVHVEEHYAPLP